ncbi:hypothetical protein LTR53_015380 [Teratosphaeriaceae sp. CCFEE 6253]|nr:hypothetical protein LTR53_015380 [Teratosphaeriaceae sp. CCFEE 6253]
MADHRRTRRPLYAPPPPPSRGQHTALGFWVPLVLTSTLALGGLAAWIWSERNDDDDEHESYRPDKPPRPRPGEGGAGYPPTQHGQGGGSSGVGLAGGAPAGYAGPIPNQSAGPQGGPAPAPSTGGGGGGGGGGEAASYYSAQTRGAYSDDAEHDQTFFGQVRGAMRRTPSPQQFLDHASKQVSAGLAAAGSALGSIMEDGEHSERAYGGTDERKSREGSRRREEKEREGFSDHERWSEEADERVQVRGAVETESQRRADAAARERGDPGKGKGKARKSVAVVVSADTNMDGKMDDRDIVYDQHASILSHLLEHHDPSHTDLFVLIYAPGLTALPPITYRPSTMTIDTASNLDSPPTYPAVPTPLATPGSELQSISPRIAPEPDFPSPGHQFDALYTQALSLVDSPTKILCFTTPAGYVPLLRHLSPGLAYVSDLLSGDAEGGEGGNVVAKLRGWVGRVVVVVGDDGTGGLGDSDWTEEDDEEREGGEGGGAGGKGKGKGKKKAEPWWENSALVGLGKGLEVVDAARVGDDWAKRVGGRK